MSHPHPALPDHRPLIVAHRAGNSAKTAARAVKRGVDMLEADIWRYQRRLEIRHLKTMGPVPLLWDRWILAPGWAPRLDLHHLLDTTPVDTRIMLDLKGHDPMLAPSIVKTIRDRQPDRAIIMCTRYWGHLDRMKDDAGVHRIYSVGSEQERATVWSRLEAMEHPAVSIHRELLTPAIARRFADLGVTVLVWSANTRDEARLLLDLGADGLTVSNGPVQDWLLSERRSLR
ncbi:MAG: hypothetical protein H0U38_05140 [Chloroflexia bacterium]|nr:hypothetical protein [Chloroflexia bacterium]MDQ3613707.1 hypothetical protein [Chloroflexota bacterium]